MDTKDLTSAFQKKLPLKEQIKAIFAGIQKQSALSGIPPVLADVMIPLMISQAVVENYNPNEIKRSITSGEVSTNFIGLAIAVQSVSRAEIEKVFQAALVKDIESARLAIADTDKSTQGLTLSDKINIANAFYSVLPDAFSAYKTVLLKGKTIEESVTEQHNMTFDQRAQQMLEESQAINALAIVDSIYNMMQNVTPENLKAVMLNILDTVTVEQVKTIALSGYAFVKDLGDTVLTQDAIDVKDKDNAVKFGADLKSVFNAIIAGFDKAGLTLDLPVTPVATSKQPKAKKKQVKKNNGAQPS